ncbi:recombinase family protein [Mesorhizobium sp. M0778]|uniref:recombinase family protein n=1 Tax=Mesorhizobium sp. M0778 TaxID=2956999 RepID=UPI003335CBCF
MSLELQSQPRICAAQYIRMSTEHQRYSLENQAVAIAEYAERRGYTIVQTYEDAGKSGLSIRGRDGLKQLLADVVTGQKTFSAILVLDVSRWGRFPDTDQSAHYEFLCRDAGVAVEYCGEQFENDGSMVSAILKNMKRVMASEYSRELSAKVSRAQLQQARLGFSQGGPVPYGVRRMLLDKDGVPRFLLGSGEQKGLAGDRVLLVPGPPNEIRLVRRIFNMFVSEGQSMAGISVRLNKEGEPSTCGEPWTTGRVASLLKSELMIGYYVYNRTSHSMSSQSRPNPPGKWVRIRVMEPIVTAKIFKKAQLARGKHGYTYTKPEMLKNLKRLYREKKRLSLTLINACPYTASASCYIRLFGSLKAVYAAVGYVAYRRWSQRQYSDGELLDGFRRLRAAHGYLTRSLINADSDLPIYRVFKKRFGSMAAAYTLAGFPGMESELELSAVARIRPSGPEGLRRDVSKPPSEGLGRDRVHRFRN